MFKDQSDMQKVYKDIATDPDWIDRFRHDADLFLQDYHLDSEQKEHLCRYLALFI